MIKGLKPELITDWGGLDQFTDAQELPPNRWVDSLNVVVSPSSNALALRSPANWNDALSTTNKVLSTFYYDRAAGGVVLFDINASSGSNVATYSTAGTTNTSRRTGQANARWVSINVNDKAYRVNGLEFIQYVSSLSAYAVGIAAPAAAPSVSFVAGGSGSLATGVTVSYAYRNSTTLHVGEASIASVATGASATDLTLRIGVVASGEVGVDGIVLFITQDAGSVRYLYVDAAGDPVVNLNATANIDISLALLGNLNFNVEETVFNAPPLATGTHISGWKNRLMLTGFTGATTRQQIAYSGFDQIFYGQPWEAWPPLNVITIPNKSESMKGGIETSVGWLGLSDRDAYLLTGTPTDKVDSGENTLQITEQLRQLKWGIGTRSPLSIQNTQYGTMWLDQNKHIQFWPWQGAPEPVALGLWNDLETIQDTDAARAMVEAKWYQVGKNGGFYVLTASTTGSTNNRMWFVTVIRKNGALSIVGAPSDIAAQSIEIGIFSGVTKCLIGITDRVRTILDFDTAGAGWPSGTRQFFTFISGALLGNFSGLHSLRYDGTKAGDLIVRVSKFDGTESVTSNPTYEDGSHFAQIDAYGTVQKVTFEFPADDAAKREVKDVRLANRLTRRVI